MKSFCGYFQRLPILLFSFFVLASPDHLAAGTLAGKITDASTHLPVRDASVVLLELGQRQYTAEGGEFSFASVAPGRYTISVRHLAYAGVERSITCIGGNCDSILVELQPALLPSDEVVVRSTRTSTAAQGIPYSSDVETGGELVRLSSVAVSDAIKDSPGIALIRDGSWETDVSIRGMGRSNIVTMIDGTRIETATDISGALSLLDVHDLDRVEIVKTPGSVLYGTGAFGGVVHMITKRNSFTDQPRMNAETTNDISSVDGKVSQYAAFESSAESYALRLSGSIRNAGNTMTPDGEIPNSQYHDFSINGSLGARTFGDQSLFLSVPALPG